MEEDDSIVDILRAVTTAKDTLESNIESIKEELIGINCPSILELKDRIDEILKNREEYQRELKVTEKKLDKYKRKLEKCEAELARIFKLSIISIMATILIVISIIIVELNYGIMIMPLYLVISLFALIIVGVVLFYISYTMRIKERYHYSDLKEIVQSLSDRVHKLKNKIDIQTTLYDEYMGKFSIRSYQLCKCKDDLISLTYLLNNLSKYLLDISKEIGESRERALRKLIKIKAILEKIDGLTLCGTLLDEKYRITIKVEENLFVLINGILRNNEIKNIDGSIVISPPSRNITIPLGKAIYKLFST